MTYSIERVEWKASAETVREVLHRSFPSVPDSRYTWLHEGNPAGPSALWLACTTDGRAVGTTAVHGRRVVVDGQLYRAGLAVDFAVDPSARGFGPAILLQRAVAAACESGEFAFIYGFPNSAARAVFERVGYRLGKARRLARPLRSRPYLERTTHVGPVARLLAMPLDLAIRLASRETYRFTSPRARVERVQAFDTSFDSFWRRIRSQHAVIADRDSAYMNWRYAKCPLRHYEFAVLRDGEDVLATVVWHRIDDLVYIAELLALDGASFDDVLVSFLRMQRREGACAVSLILLGDDGFASRLADYGFFLREVGRTMMVYVPAGSPLAASLGRLDRWALFEGDVL